MSSISNKDFYQNLNRVFKFSLQSLNEINILTAHVCLCTSLNSDVILASPYGGMTLSSIKISFFNLSCKPLVVIYIKMVNVLHHLEV